MNTRSSNHMPRKLKQKSSTTIFFLVLFAISPLSAFNISSVDTEGVSKTVHNMIKGLAVENGKDEQELCVWCHIPHVPMVVASNSPKWHNSQDITKSFNIYGIKDFNETLNGSDRPDIMVSVCLTCHDGISAPNISLFSTEATLSPLNLGAVSPVSVGVVIPTNSLSTSTIIKRTNNSGASVHSHPVGIPYTPASSSGKKASLRPKNYPLSGWSGASTISDLIYNGEIRCTSCHDPHTTNSYFLRTQNTLSELCIGCHNK